jgi:hypothetical protein
LEPYFYKPPFLKHLHNLVVNGFYARELDADDHAFLEYVKTRGLANGSLPGSNVVLLEELEFWHLPYTIAPGVERRVGRRPRPVEASETDELRKARSNAWHARRIIRENEKAIAEVELQRERREWEKAQQQRKVRELISDAEWEASAPTHASFGATVGRHHVPQWKLEEAALTGRPAGSGQKKSRRRLAREAAERTQARRQEEEQKRKLAAERTEIRKTLIEEQRRNDKFKQTLLRARARKAEKEIREQVAREVQQAAEAELAIAQDRQRREAIIEEARQTVDRVTRLEREWQGTANYTADALKQAILTITKHGTPGHFWTAEALMRSIGGCDRAFMDNCLNELVRDGRLRKVEKK